MFYSYGRGTDIVATEIANQAQRDARNAQSNIDIMQADVERLLLITEALWGLLKEQHGYSDEDLIDRVEQIDMKDGRLDGRVKSTEPVKCLACDRPHNHRRLNCLYCGEQLPRDLFAR